MSEQEKTQCMLPVTPFPPCFIFTSPQELTLGEGQNTGPTSAASRRWLNTSSQSPSIYANLRVLWRQVDFFEGLLFSVGIKKIHQSDDSTFKPHTATTKSLCCFLIIKRTSSNKVWAFVFSLSAQRSKQRKRVTGYVQLDFPSMLSSTRVSRFFCSLRGTESALGPCQESLQLANSTFDWVMAMAGCFTMPQLLES